MWAADNHPKPATMLHFMLMHSFVGFSQHATYFVWLITTKAATWVLSPSSRTTHAYEFLKIASIIHPLLLQSNERSCSLSLPFCRGVLPSGTQRLPGRHSPLEPVGGAGLPMPSHWWLCSPYLERPAGVTESTMNTNKSALMDLFFFPPR